MQINGTGAVHAAQPLSAPHVTRVDRTPEGPGFVAGGDEVTISREADLVARTHELPDIRHDRVEALRAQIASGTYETEAKLDLALERLLDEIA